MTAEQVEKRFQQIEAVMEDVRSRFDGSARPQPDPKSRWWETLPPPIDAALLGELEPRAKYFRQTGEYPPPDWRPGDSIPKPDHWQ